MLQTNFKSKVRSILVIVILVCSISSMIMFSNPKLHTEIAASSWVQTSKKDFLNGSFNNTTIVGDGGEAELKIDLSEFHHWTKKDPISRPSGREASAMAPISGTDKVLLFGGYGNFPYTYKDDTWIYDLSDDTWVEKTLSPKPSTRWGHAIAPIYGDDKVVLFGGRFGTDNYLNDTWVYDFSSNAWTEKSPANAPGTRGHHAMASIPGSDKILLFGGYSTTSTITGKTWIYDLSNDTWEEGSPTSSPSKRFSHAMAPIYGDDKVLLFGGLTTTFDNETWVYDLSIDDWTKMRPTNEPTPRVSHAMASIYQTGEVLLFGGSNSNGDNDEIWVYDLNINDWTQKIPVNITNCPEARSTHAMASIYGDDIVVLFGGRIYPNRYNDTWTFKHFIHSKNGTYISEPYDMGSRSSFYTISWSANIPTNTSIRLQLKTATTMVDLNSKDFLGPDGLPSTYYTSSPTDIWSGHDFDRWVQYKVYFNMRVFTYSPGLKDVTILYNCLPITKIISPINRSVLTDNNPTFEWTFEDFDSEEQKAFQVLIDDNISFDEVEFDTGIQITNEQYWKFPTGTNYTELPDGLWYWKVRTKDTDNAWTEFSSPWSFTIDTHAPTSAPNLPLHNEFYNSITLISGIANDAAPGSGVNKVEITINRFIDAKYWNGTSWISETTWLLTSGTTNWTYDSSTIPWLSGGKYSIQSRATDNATNIEHSDNKNSFTVDMESPTSNVDIPMNNVWLNKLNTISGNSIDIGGSGIDNIQIGIICTKDYIKWDGGPKENNYWDGTKWISTEFWLQTTGTNIWSYDASTIPWTTGDHYTIHSRAIDKTSNVESPGPGPTFMYDDKPPENLRIFINNETEYTKSSSVILSLQAEDIGSGISQMSFSTDSAFWSDWEPFNTTRTFELSTGDGDKTIYIRVKDYTGNIAEPVFDIIILDTTPPDELSIVINENSKYINSKHVKLNLKATDKLSGVSDISLSYDGYNWYSWEPFTYEKYTWFPDDINDGENRIFFKVRDSAGNIAEPVFDSIILDTTPPYSLSISINNGDSETNSTSVTLDLSATDNTSGISEISFSTDSKYWTGWEPFMNEMFFTLPPNDGEKTVYFRVRDRAGNIAEPVSTTIMLKTTSPEEDSHTPIKSSESIEIWVILLIIIIILIAIIIAGLIMKRKKHVDQEPLLLPVGVLTIKPGELTTPVISMDKLPSSGADAPQPFNLVPSTSIPQLVKSTQTRQESISQQTTPSQVLKLPQLPPAQVETSTTEQDVSSVVPTLATPQPSITESSIQPEQQPTTTTTDLGSATPKQEITNSLPGITPERQQSLELESGQEKKPNNNS